jgi:hypothetical protein
MTRHASVGKALAAVVAALVAAIAASGVAAGTAVPPCPSRTLTQPFLPWGDRDPYFLAPEGSMESTYSWSLENGARRVPGNEPFYVNSSADRFSLALPYGSSAQTAPMCVTIFNPTMRFFARNSGSASSSLKVEVLYMGRDGIQRTATVGTITGGLSWTPSPALSFLRYTAPAVGGGGQTWVSFRFRPTGWGGNWQIDDLYVDPLKGF